MAAPQPLEKDQWHCLKEGDIFSLVPGKYIYRVHVKEDDQTLRWFSLALRHSFIIQQQQSSIWLAVQEPLYLFDFFKERVNILVLNAFDIQHEIKLALIHSNLASIWFETLFQSEMIPYGHNEVLHCWMLSHYGSEIGCKCFPLTSITDPREYSHPHEYSNTFMHAVLSFFVILK